MCGINGFNFENEALVQKMNERTSHRGPDGVGSYVGSGVSLGHNRLAIIDTSSRGAQPMWNADRTVAIIFNGEIYNFQDLKSEIRDQFAWASETDTEVVLHGYEKWGRGVVKKLNGMFAFAIFDTRDGSLTLARDPAGIKPLYYFYDGGRFIFSSEIKALFAHDIPREVDLEAFNLFMRVLYVPAPRTGFKHIFKLLPGHAFTVRHGEVQDEQFWSVADHAPRTSYGEAREMVLRLAKDAVRRQVVADRPVGVFLSGGVDSTAVLGMIREVAPEITKTYSVGFDVAIQRERFNADFELARQTAAHYGTDHHEIMIGARDMRDNLERIAYHMDEPNANATTCAIMLLSREAKKDVAVVLGGDGGDELFGGYPRYQASAVIDRWQQVPRVFRRPIESLVAVGGRANLVAQLRTKPGFERAMAFLAQKEHDLEAIIRPEVSNAPKSEHFHALKHESADATGRFMQFDRESWLVDESLLRTDKMTMSAGLEARVPILDLRMIELAAHIPTAWKIHSRHGKVIWRDAMRPYLPPHLAGEPKRGFFSPIAKWLREDLHDPAQEILASADERLFDREGLLDMFDDHVSGKKYNANLIWATVMWHLWWRNMN